MDHLNQNTIDINMKFFDKKYFTTNSFVIAEIGQNHQGDIDLAKKYISEFANAGAHAVKFQTRNNKLLFSEESYNKDYNSDNAFAKKYGQHREHLELDRSNYPELLKECKKFGIKFMSTPFDEDSLNFLVKVGVEIIKIASFDLGNLPLIDKIAKTKIPVVISIGGGNIDQIKSSVDTILNHHDDLSILHCVSEYPCPYDRLGLENIKVLISAYPKTLIGLSDHFNGILSASVAYLKGARVFEKHVTFNRSWMGTDHKFSLEPIGFKKMVRDLRRIPKMFSVKSDGTLGNEPVFIKLGKSLIAATDIKKGDKFTYDNLSGKIFEENIIPVRESNEILNKISKINYKKGDPITYDGISS